MAAITVEGYYGRREGYAETILAAASRAGVTDITPVTLAPADEFHTQGVDATRALATLMGVGPDTRLLDVGCGLGGPLRMAASEFGCTGVGLDLTPEFVRSARILTERCGLADRVSFETGDATRMPFPDATFDMAWTQHAVMNIADRPVLYREVFRVLRPGGRFGFFDILLAEGGGDLSYPLPWASDPAISHLCTPNETRDLLRDAGFRGETWRDTTAEALVFFQKQAAIMTAGPPPPLHLGLVIGEDFPERLRNLGLAARDRKLRLVQATYTKP